MFCTTSVESGTLFDERKMSRLACCVDFIVLKKGTDYIFPEFFSKEVESLKINMNVKVHSMHSFNNEVAMNN